jgi:hypothetical protein
VSGGCLCVHLWRSPATVTVAADWPVSSQPHLTCQCALIGRLARRPDSERTTYVRPATPAPGCKHRLLVGCRLGRRTSVTVATAATMSLRAVAAWGRTPPPPPVGPGRNLNSDSRCDVRPAAASPGSARGPASPWDPGSWGGGLCTVLVTRSGCGTWCGGKAPVGAQPSTPCQPR